MPLDDFLPDFDFNEVHSTRIAAAPERALAATRELTAREMPVMLALVALRRLGRTPTRGRVVDAMVAGGFVVLADRPDELVLGVAGRFWTFDGGVARISGEEFERFDEPNHAKAVMDFHAHPAPGGCLLRTETRVKAIDEAARRSFGCYWRVVHPGSALIRRGWLRAAKRRAERG